MIPKTLKEGNKFIFLRTQQLKFFIFCTVFLKIQRKTLIIGFIKSFVQSVHQSQICKDYTKDSQRQRRQRIQYSCLTPNTTLKKVLGVKQGYNHYVWSFNSKTITFIGLSLDNVTWPGIFYPWTKPLR